MASLASCFAGKTPFQASSPACDDMPGDTGQAVKTRASPISSTLEDGTAGAEEADRFRLNSAAVFTCDRPDRLRPFDVLVCAGVLQAGSI